jgi:hypothetical protein
LNVEQQCYAQTRACVHAPRQHLERLKSVEEWRWRRAHDDYNLPATDAIYQRFVGIEGSAYFVGGLGRTALSFNNIVVVPVRSGVGLRLGANVGYLKFTPTSTWNPF